MRTNKTSRVWTYAVSLLGLGLVNAASAADLKLSDTETKKFSTCMAMKSPELDNDHECVALMKKTKVSKTDIEKIQACESAQVDAVKDPDCQAMMKKHPEMLRGHGRMSQPAE